MKNFIQPGKVLEAAAPSGGVVSGGLYIIGSIVCVAEATAAEGVVVGFATEGVFEQPKTSAQAWTFGAKIYWTSGGLATTVASGNTFIGVAAEVAANPSATGKVKLVATAI